MRHLKASIVLDCRSACMWCAVKSRLNMYLFSWSSSSCILKIRLVSILMILSPNASFQFRWDHALENRSWYSRFAKWWCGRVCVCLRARVYLCESHFTANHLSRGLIHWHGKNNTVRGITSMVCAHTLYRIEIIFGSKRNACLSVIRLCFMQIMCCHSPSQFNEIL